jgi:hypothetical protein
MINETFIVQSLGVEIVLCDTTSGIVGGFYFGKADPKMMLGDKLSY